MSKNRNSKNVLLKKSGTANTKRSDLILLPITLISIGIFFLAILSSFMESSTNASSKVQAKFLKDFHHFYNDAEILRESIQLKMDQNILQQQFINTKTQYKKVEFMIEYLNPTLAKNLNGAPIPSVLIEQEKYQTLNPAPPVFRTFPPQGLQVLEELIFSEDYSEKKLSEAVALAITLEEQSLLFINAFNNQSLNDRQIIESCREELIRIMTLGISGFDAPAAGNEIKFCETALESVRFTAACYHDHDNPEVGGLAKKVTKQLDRSLQFLSTNGNFETFDRLYFIRELADPIYGSFTDLQQILLHSQTSLAKPVNDTSRSLFDKHFLQTSFYAKQDRKEQSKELILLGQSLFFDPILSANNERSCASCHHPSKAFTDGQAKSIAFDFKGTVSRNSPTLLNAVFSNAYFWDSRAQYLQDQVPAVILQKEELHGSYEAVIDKLNQSKVYKKMFAHAFDSHPENSINVNTINRAIAAYVQSLVAINSSFDRYMRSETDTLSMSVKKGFNLFMGKAGCGTCHFAPTFNGTVPPRYIESESEVLGVPDNANLKIAKLDIDHGKAAFIPADFFKHSFKTPTIRNASFTAPYMHNGVFSTLEEVMNFYDLGGGASLGFDLPNQTLPSEPLHLSEEEKKDIIAFIHSLSDTANYSAPPFTLPGFNKNTRYNKRQIGGTY